MATSGKSAALYMGAFNWSSYLNKISPDRPMKLEDVSTFGPSGVQRIALLQDPKLDAGGFWDPTTVSGPDVRAIAQLDGAQFAMTYFPTGAGVSGNTGNVAQLYLAREANYKIDGSVTGATLIDVATQGDGLAPTGVCVHAIGAETTTSADGTPHINRGVTDNAPQLFKYVMNLHVTAFTGTNATILIQHSHDGSSGWVDVDTFTQVTTAGGITSEQKSGTKGAYITQFLRWVLSGTFTTITFTVSVAVF